MQLTRKMIDIIYLILRKFNLKMLIFGIRFMFASACRCVYNEPRKLIEKDRHEIDVVLKW